MHLINPLLAQSGVLTTHGLSQPELLNLGWVLVCAVLVLLMQAGFCCLETGLVRAKNSINVAIKNLVDFCVCSLIFWMFGYALMFGRDYAGLFGTTRWLVPSDLTPSELTFFIFQAMFCGTAATIISGAVAERIRFWGYLMITLVIAALVYPLFGHWAWAGGAGEASGWLRRLGFVDFAGSSVVHGTGGWVALAAAIVIGPRIGQFDKADQPIRGHNLAIASLGVLLLWVGWLGFNGGSSFEISSRTPIIFINTCLAGAVGGITLMGFSWVSESRPTVEWVINGVISGLVGITACCNSVTPQSSVVIGAIAAVVCFMATRLMVRLKIDDAIGAVPAHACAGAWGVIAVALFADPAVLDTGLSRWEQLGVQALGTVVCFAWSFGVGYVFLSLINRLTPLRVSAEQEQAGLNMAEHGASTALLDLLYDMEQQRQGGDFSKHVSVDPHTEVGQIALQYNRVLQKVNEDTSQLVSANEQISLINQQLTEARDQEVNARSQLQAHVDDLKTFNQAAVGRELRMIELKKEVNGLLETKGTDPRYDLSFLQNDDAATGWQETAYPKNNERDTD